jgi:four helix bundle protein
LVEVDNHIEIAKTLDYINIESLKTLDQKLNELFAKLSKFIENAK